MKFERNAGIVKMFYIVGFLLNFWLSLILYNEPLMWSTIQLRTSYAATVSMYIHS